MKILLIYLGSFLLIVSCSSNRDDFDLIVSNEWTKCNGDKNCTIDFSNMMNFKWDTMCFFSGGCSLEEINKDLGFELNEFTDTGDRILFLNKGKVVYQKEWYNIPSEATVGTIIVSNLKKFKVIKSEAKFRITKEANAYFLYRL